MKKISIIALMVVVYLILSSCQQIFTYSALEWAERDPSDSSTEQQIVYARNVLMTGDTEAMGKAYALINDLVTADPDDVELQLLAADLSLGATGIADGIEDLDLNDPVTSMEVVLSSIDPAFVTVSIDHLLIAGTLDSTAITPERFLNTGFVLLAKAAVEAGGFANLSTIIFTSPAWPMLIQANDFIILGGGDIEDYGITNTLP